MTEVFQCSTHLFTANTVPPDRASEPALRRPLARDARGRWKIIDIHCHIGVPAADELAARYGAGPPVIARFASEATRAVNTAQMRSIAPKLNGIEARLADMDGLGIDIQVLSPSPAQYHYGLEPDAGHEVARLVNDSIAAAVASHPERFAGLATVPLQSPELAVRELRRAVRSLGLRGVEISTYVGTEELSGESLRPFFDAAAELDVLVFIHPLGFSHGERLSAHYLNNLIGNPLESSIAVAQLIFGGVLDRNPGLKVCVAHGGGFLPSYWGRLDHAFRVRDDCRQFIQRPPSTYLHELYYDTLVFDRDHLSFLLKTYGAHHLCLGTDYPFDMSEPDPLGAHSHLPEAERALILGGTAARLLGLDV